MISVVAEANWVTGSSKEELDFLVDIDMGCDDYLK